MKVDKALDPYGVPNAFDAKDPEAIGARMREIHTLSLIIQDKNQQDLFFAERRDDGGPPVILKRILTQSYEMH